MPFVLRLLLRNAFRHKLRTLLTLVGLVVAISAFGLLRTIVDAWYAGVDDAGAQGQGLHGAPQRRGEGGLRAGGAGGAHRGGPQRSERRRRCSALSPSRPVAISAQLPSSGTALTPMTPSV